MLLPFTTPLRNSAFTSSTTGAETPLVCSFAGGSYSCSCTNASLPGRLITSTGVQCAPCVAVTAQNVMYTATTFEPSNGTVDLCGEGGRVASHC